MNLYLSFFHAFEHTGWHLLKISTWSFKYIFDHNLISSFIRSDAITLLLLFVQIVWSPNLQSQRFVSAGQQIDVVASTHLSSVMRILLYLFAHLVELTIVEYLQLSRVHR